MAMRWYGLAAVLLILSLIEVTLLSYENHNTYGIVVATWGVGSLVMGPRAELKP